MKPYYQDELMTVYCGNCLDVMPTLEQVDLTVTSPPYDKLRVYEGYDFDFEAIAKELYRVTEHRGVVVWVVSDQTIKGSETLTSFKQALYFRELGFNVETMIYHNPATGAKGSNYYYWQAFEYMFVFVKEGQPKTSNRIANIENSRANMPVGVFPKNELVGSRQGRLHAIRPQKSTLSNVWRIVSGYLKNDFTDHPAPFPEKLANDHIITWSNPGEVILDPMMGSGTTGKMALLNGRKFIGIDVSEKYCEMAVNRILNSQKQLELAMWGFSLAPNRNA